jgi:hypothetical protein
MDHKEFAKYHIWCDRRGIRVYPIKANTEGAFYLVVERSGKASIGNKVFYNERPAPGVPSVWEQIGILLKAIVYKELNLMEIKSTHNQLEAIAQAAIKGNKHQIVLGLMAKVPFREAVLYMEGFYPEEKEKAKLIHQLAHCQCGNPATKWDLKTNKGRCGNCGLQKAFEQIEYGPKKKAS